MLSERNTQLLAAAAKLPFLAERIAQLEHEAAQFERRCLGIMDHETEQFVTDAEAAAILRAGCRPGRLTFEWREGVNGDQMQREWCELQRQLDALITERDLLQDLRQEETTHAN